MYPNVRSTSADKVRDLGPGLVGETWYDDELGMCTAVRCGLYDGDSVVFYTHRWPDAEGDTESFSSVAEVRAWCELACV